MKLKEVVGKAKAYTASVFEDEIVGVPTLEELWFDDETHEWCITLSVLRKPSDPFSRAAGTLARSAYKVVRISERTGEPVSIKNRDVALT